MKVKTIYNIEEFMDAVIVISQDKSDWDVKPFMDSLQKHILASMKTGQMVSADVMVAYFNLYTLLGNKASRQRIRAAALAVKSWIQHRINSYGTESDSQQRELLENQGR
jgi:hypothetical protein